MALGAQQIALPGVRAGRADRHLERVIVLRSVHAVAARARRFAALEAAGQRDRLRAVEAARPAVGPEIALGIVGRQWLADEERDRVILVLVAGLESEERVVLVAVAVAARVEHLAGGRRARREDLEQGAQPVVLRARIVGGLARRILRPLVHQRDVIAPGTVARLAPDPHLGPRRLVRVGRDVVVLHEIRRVAVDAGDVPDLPQLVLRIVGDRRDLLPVHPALRHVVPEDRQHVDAAVRELREIALEPARAEGVVHLELLRGPAALGDADEVVAVARLHRVRASVCGEAHGSALPDAEVADDQRLIDRLGHLDVERLVPRAVFGFVAALAGRRPDVARAVGGGRGSRLRLRLLRDPGDARIGSPDRQRAQCRDADADETPGPADEHGRQPL